MSAGWLKFENKVQIVKRSWVAVLRKEITARL